MRPSNENKNNALDLKNIDSGIRAFVYQQIAELEEFLPIGSSIDVKILAPEEGSEKKPLAKDVEAQIEITLEEGQLNLSSSGVDEYEAIKSAVESAKTNLVEEFPFEGESVLDARESLVNAIIEKDYLH